MAKLSNEVRDLLIKRMIEKVTMEIYKLAEEDRDYGPGDTITITYQLDVRESNFTAKRDVEIEDITFKT